MAREWVINNYSGYKGLTLQQCKPQKAGPGEIRLRIEAFALKQAAILMVAQNQFPACLRN